MKKLVFSILIKASRQKIWEVLWNDRTYRLWTAAFCEGSYVETDWKEGARVLFLNGDKNGMYSVLEENKPLERMSFKHIGNVEKGIEIPLDKDSQQWTGAMEIYTLIESEEGVKLMVEIDTLESFQDFLTQDFPVGLEKVRELSEG